MGLETDQGPNRFAWTRDWRLLTGLALHGFQQVDATADMIEQYVGDARERLFRDSERHLESGPEDDEEDEPDATRRGIRRAMRAVEDVCNRLRYALRGRFVLIGDELPARFVPLDGEEAACSDGAAAPSLPDPACLLERIANSIRLVHELDEAAFVLELHLRQMAPGGVFATDGLGSASPDDASADPAWMYPEDLLLRVEDRVTGWLGAGCALLELARRIRDEERAVAARVIAPTEAVGPSGPGGPDGEE